MGSKEAKARLEKGAFLASCMKEKRNRRREGSRDSIHYQLLQMSGEISMVVELVEVVGAVLVYPESHDGVGMGMME